MKKSAHLELEHDGEEVQDAFAELICLRPVLSHSLGCGSHISDRCEPVEAQFRYTKEGRG